MKDTGIIIYNRLKDVKSYDDFSALGAIEELDGFSRIEERSGSIRPERNDPQQALKYLCDTLKWTDEESYNRIVGWMRTVLGQNDRKKLWGKSKKFRYLCVQYRDEVGREHLFLLGCQFEKKRENHRLRLQKICWTWSLYSQSETLSSDSSGASSSMDSQLLGYSNRKNK
eukprot:CAMPEP_0201552558 /NCGR_PEP_ID=MMETSP0173_2-20130828/16785_1 /ASSEMBLY_ACC=CAM_ASM_000268 /TAXON_ID=218659 /ORGANISM="Vexillifera sp., Strain DIVA3 564/2" /LENGTH=169 /DNA_ID=CAMNT_0047963059 /DNA_START=320 /DNA_END=829 /DNA_ORIENTATION=-